jgi:hypothetical protein
MFERSSVVTVSADSIPSSLVKGESGERFISIDPGLSCGRVRYLTWPRPTALRTGARWRAGSTGSSTDVRAKRLYFKANCLAVVALLLALAAWYGVYASQAASTNMHDGTILLAVISAWGCATWAFATARDAGNIPPLSSEQPFFKNIAALAVLLTVPMVLYVVMLYFAF